MVPIIPSLSNRGPCPVLKAESAALAQTLDLVKHGILRLCIRLYHSWHTAFPHGLFPLLC